MRKIKFLIKNTVRSFYKLALKAEGLFKSYTVLDKESAVKQLEQYGNHTETINQKYQKTDTNTQYDLDIIVPVYNVEEYLEECIESILSQETGYRFRVICINDGSTDKSEEILKKYQNKDSRILLINQDNKGLSGARNAGLAVSDAKYLMFVDSDDILERGAIELSLKEAYSEDADIVEGGYCRIDHYGEKYGIHDHKSGSITKNELSGFAWMKVYKHDLFENVLFQEGYWFEDTIIRFLIALKAKKSIGIKNCVYLYRDNKHGISNTSRKSNKAVDTVLVMLETYKAVIQQGLSFDGEDYLALMEHIVLSTQRMKYLCDELNFAAFSVWHHFICLNFKHYTGTKHKYSQLERLIIEKKYKAFLLYCKYAV